MKRKFLAVVVGLTLVTISSVSFAQFGGLGAALGGKNVGSGGVSAEDLVKSYVGGTKQVMGAEAKLLEAVGLKTNAEKVEFSAKSLTEGPTKASLEEVLQVQTENNKALADSMGANKVVLSAESKKTYVAGVVNLVKGIKSYIGMSSDVQGFKPSITSMGAAAGAAMFVVKSLPDSISSLKNTLKSAIDFAKENKITLPSDATSGLPS